MCRWDRTPRLWSFRGCALRLSKMGRSAHCRGARHRIRSSHWVMRPRGQRYLAIGPWCATREVPPHDPPSGGLSLFLRAPFVFSGDGSTAASMAAMAVRKVLLASPRGYCAGVERAVETVEKALDLYGPPVYVRKQIVHNLHVVRDLEERGAVFVDDEREVPEGRTVVFSAHGVAPSVHANAEARGLSTIDATCPLVTKVHVQARRYAAAGYTVVLVGHAGHEEVVGTMGEAPESMVLVESVDDVEQLAFPPGTRLAYVTQTTLSVDETGEIITALRRRFPDIYAPKKEDICYATSNRQWAVKDLLAEVDLLLVIGSRNSSNSNRLVEVARVGGVGAYLIDDETEIDESWLDGVDVAGVTSGASAPEKLVERVCDWFRARGVTEIEPYRLVDEAVEFRLPIELRRELVLAAEQA